jgi:hypothetical protein
VLSLWAETSQFQLFMFVSRMYRVKYRGKAIAGTHATGTGYGEKSSVQPLNFPRRRYGTYAIRCNAYQPRSPCYRLQDIIITAIFTEFEVQNFTRGISAMGPPWGSAIFIKEGKRPSVFALSHVHFKYSQAHRGASRSPCQRVGTCHN